MIKQIKFIAWKLAFAAAVVAVFFGFRILADAGETKIPEVNAVETSAQTDDKPLVRCPNKAFLLRTPCKTVKPVKPQTEAGSGKVSPERASAGDNKNSSARVP